MLISSSFFVKKSFGCLFHLKFASIIDEIRGLVSILEDLSKSYGYLKFITFWAKKVKKDLKMLISSEISDKFEISLNFLKVSKVLLA